MDFVNLGNTGLKVSRLCLGCMTYGSSRWREWVLKKEESRPFIQHALEGGINFFDTANMYSDGASEEVVGRALKDFGKRDEIVLATKVYNPVRAVAVATRTETRTTAAACDESAHDSAGCSGLVSLVAALSGKNVGRKQQVKLNLRRRKQ